MLARRDLHGSESTHERRNTLTEAGSVEWPEREGRDERGGGQAIPRDTKRVLKNALERTAPEKRAVYAT